jgi:hypothetical protein
MPFPSEPTVNTDTNKDCLALLRVVSSPYWIYILSIFPVTQGFSKFSHHYRFFDQFLGAFEKFWKATISFIMSVAVSPFVCMEQLGFQWTDFHKILYWVFFENLLRKLEFHYNVTRITGILHENLSTFMIVSRWILLKMRKSLDESCNENQNTHFIFKFLWKSCCLWGNMQKCSRAGEATVDNIIRPARVHYMLDNWGYKHTLVMFNTGTYCFSTVTAVTQMRLNFTFIPTLPVKLWVCYLISPILFFSWLYSLRQPRPSQVEVFLITFS